MLSFRFLLCMMPMLFVGVSYAAEKPQAKPTPAPAIPKVVRAQAFELTDAAGKPRAWLGTLEDGSAVLKLLDADAKPTVTVDSGGRIVVLDANGASRMTAGVMGDGYGIGLLDLKGTTRAEVKLSESQTPMMIVRDADGNLRGSLMALDIGPILMLSDGKEDGARLGVKINGSEPALGLWDASGKRRTYYSLLEDGAPVLQMTDTEGEILAEIAASDDRPTLLLQSQKSKMAAYLGFTKDTEVWMMMLNDKGNLQAGMALDGTDPSIAIRHQDEEPAAGMWFSDEGIPYFATDDADGLPLWASDGF